MTAGKEGFNCWRSCWKQDTLNTICSELLELHHQSVAGCLDRWSKITPNGSLWITHSFKNISRLSRCSYYFFVYLLKTILSCNYYLSIIIYQCVGYYLNKMTVECQNLSHENTDSIILNAFYSNINFFFFLLFTWTWAKTPSVFRLHASSLPPQHLISVTPVRGRPVRGPRARSCVGLEHGLDGGDGVQGQRSPPCAPQQKLWRLKTSERSDGIGGAAGGEEDDLMLLRFAPSLRGVPGASIKFAACLVSLLLRPPRDCPTTVCLLQMTSSDSGMFSLPLIKEEDNEPWRCSQTIVSPHSSSWSSVCSRTLFTFV